MSGMHPRRRRNKRMGPQGQAQTPASWVQRLLPGFDKSEVVRLKVAEVARKVADAVVPAAPPKTRAAASVWALAAKAARDVVAEDMEEAIDSGRTTSALPRPISSASRDPAAGRQVVTGRAYPANRWTEERAEAERVRRAKQRPPKPNKQQFKLKNSRVFKDSGDTP